MKLCASGMPRAAFQTMPDAFLGGRMERPSRRDHLVEGAGWRQTGPIEQVSARGQNFDRDVDRHPILALLPHPGAPDDGMEILALDVVRPREATDRVQSAPRAANSASQGTLRVTTSNSDTGAAALATSRACRSGSTHISKSRRDARLLRKSTHMLRIEAK